MNAQSFQLVMANHGTSYVYDGDGIRHKRLDAIGTIHYLGAYEPNVGTEANPSEVVTKYYAASLGGPPRLIALRRGGTLHCVGTIIWVAR